MMGAWNKNIFDEDGSADIIADYKILLGYKVTPYDAYDIIEKYYLKEYKEQDDEDVYWLSIALFQWQNGILDDQVKTMALKCIDDGKYLERWKDSGEQIYNKRKEIIKTFKDNLLYVNNPIKIKFPKCPQIYKEKTPFNVGDLLIYKYNDSTINNIYIKKCVLLRVVDVKSHPVTKLCPELDYYSNANFMLYDWIGDESSMPNSVDDLCFKVMAIDYVKGIWRVVSSVDLDYYGRKNDKAVCDVEILGNDKKYINVKPQMYIDNNGSPWETPKQFNYILRQTFNLTNTSQTEWLYKE